MPLPVASLALLVAASTIDPPKVDRYGDPLPAGAVARLGTVHLDARAMTRNYRFAADGKTFHAEAAGPAWAEWDAATGKLLRRVRLPGLDGSWPWVSADGSVALCEQPEGVLRVVEVKTGKVRFGLSDGTQVKHLTDPFSPDGRWLAGFDRRSPPWVRVWDTATGRERRFDSPGPQPVPLRFSPDGSKLVALGDGGMTCWDVAAGRRLWHRRPAADGEVVFSPDGRWVTRRVMAGVEVLDAATGEPPAGFKPVPSEVTEATAFTPDGTALLALQSGGGFKWGLWDLAGGRWRVQWDAPNLYRGVPDPAGKTVLAYHVTGRFQRWDLTTGKPLYPDVGGRGHTHGAGEAAFDRTGRKVFTLGGDQTLREWDAADGRLVRTVPGLPPPADQGGPRLVVRPDGDRVVIEGAGFQHLGARVLHVLDLTARNRREVDVSRRPDGLVWHGRPRLLADGTLRRVADGRRYHGGGRWTGGDDVEDWDLTAGSRLRVRPVAHQPAIRHWDLASTARRAAELSPDGRLASDGTMVAEVDGGQVLFRLAWADLEGRPDAAFSADGRFVAVRMVRPVRVRVVADGPRPRTAVRDDPAGVWVWDIPTRSPVARVPVGADRMALTPDGRFLLTLDATGISAWDLVTARQIVHHKADPRGGYHEGASFTQILVPAPDGRTAVTGRHDGTCLVWDFSAAYKQAATPPPSDADLAAVWAGWAKPDANPPAGLWRMADHPDRSVPFLRAKVKELVKPGGPTAEDITKAIAELDSPDFKTREAAEKRLAEYHAAARPAMAAALPKGSPEARVRLGRVLDRLDADPVPPLRPEDAPLAWAVAALERINTADARAVVEQIAAGPPQSRLTREAKAALDRLRR